MIVLEMEMSANKFVPIFQAFIFPPLFFTPPFKSKLVLRQMLPGTFFVCLTSISNHPEMFSDAVGVWLVYQDCQV